MDRKANKYAGCCMVLHYLVWRRYASDQLADQVRIRMDRYVCRARRLRGRKGQSLVREYKIPIVVMSGLDIGSVGVHGKERPRILQGLGKGRLRGGAAVATRLARDGPPEEHRRNWAGSRKETYGAQELSL